MAWSYGTGFPAVIYDVPGDDDLREDITLQIPQAVQRRIWEKLNAFAHREGLTHPVISRLRLTWFVECERNMFLVENSPDIAPEAIAPEASSSNASTRSPSTPGSGSSDETVDPAALGQRTDRNSNRVPETPTRPPPMPPRPRRQVPEAIAYLFAADPAQRQPPRQQRPQH